MLYGFFYFFRSFLCCASNTVLVLRGGHQGYWRNRKRACLASTRYWDRNPDTPIRYGVVGNISACHADARGSIPRFGVLFFYFFEKIKIKIKIFLLGFEPRISRVLGERHNQARPQEQASNEDRTRDLALTKRMLCQLSYRGERTSARGRRVLRSVV